MTTTPRLRFAPSPTGPLHLGGARTALYNWAAARALGGKFLLRIEDTDRARSTDESLRIILEGLRWLGIDWDEGPETGGDFGPYFQTQRLELYRKYADQLLESGAAYKCYATPEEVEAGRQRLVAEGKHPMYDRRDRDLTEAQRAAHEAEGRKPSLRFRMPLDQAHTLEDLSKGPVEINLQELDDWVLVRPDGMPTYNFACVVDDQEMAITHVVRGEEHLMNGFKQDVLFGVLGLDAPRFAHIPLILGSNGKKLSKRDAVTNILEYRDAGYLPDAIFNTIALLGWTYSGEQDVFTRQELVEKFRIEDIHSGGAKFDKEKLAWMSGEYVRKLAPRKLCDAARQWLVADVVPDSVFDTHADWLANVVACYQERITLLSDLPEKIAFCFAAELELDDDAKKKLRKVSAEAPGWLRGLADVLESSDAPPSFPAARGEVDQAVQLPTDPEAEASTVPSGFAVPAQLEQLCRDYAAEADIPMGKLMLPLRLAVSGTTKGAGVFDLLFLVGKEKCVQRLRALADGLGSPVAP